jgi:AbiV family abortive infection protein
VGSKKQDEDFFLQGYRHALRNAEDLLDSAESISLLGKTGTARSLNVLAAEEAIKASFLITKHYFPNAEIKDFEDIFKNHKIKHEHLKMFIEIMVDIKNRITNVLTNVTTPALELMESLPQEYRDNNKVEYDSIRLEHDFYKTFTFYELPSAKILKWLDQANDIKNNGLYVGKSEKNWFVPNNAKTKDFEDEKSYTSQIIKAVVSVGKVYSLQKKNKVI